MDWLKFTRQERIGIAWFLLVAILVMFGPYIYKQLKTEEKSVVNFKEYNIDTTSQSIDGEKPNYESYQSWEENRNYKPYESKKLNDEYNYKSPKFDFDPNLISIDSLKLLGFSEKAAMTIEKVRTKGFHYYSAHDLKNTFGINSEFIDFIESHIKVSKKEQKINVENKLYPKVEKIVNRVEINAADSLDFEQLPKIGKYLTRKIINYRNRLGGFISKDQLITDAIIPDSVYEAIEPYLDVDISKIQGVDINNASYKSMLKHPYFTSSIVNAIEKYRKQHGAFSQPSDIRKIIALKKEEGLKILPYISTKQIESKE